MYESEVALPDISADEHREQRLLAGKAEPEIVNGVILGNRRRQLASRLVGHGQQSRAGVASCGRSLQIENAPLAAMGGAGRMRLRPKCASTPILEASDLSPD